MIFNGVGSAMPRDTKFSGVVYVYTNDSTLLFTPSGTNSNGYMVYLGDRWGNNQHQSNEVTAEVIVTVFSGTVLALLLILLCHCLVIETYWGVSFFW